MSDEANGAAPACAAESAPPRNRGGRPKNAVRIARAIARARETATLALVRCLEDASTPPSVVVQASMQLKELDALDQVERDAVRRLLALEARLRELEENAPPDPRIH